MTDGSMQHAGPATPPSDARLVTASVRGQPTLGISGISNGELTLWRRGTDTAEPQALARLTLDLDGAQLFAGGAFAGLLDPDETASLHPDWLRSIGLDNQRPEQRGFAPQSPRPLIEVQEDEEEGPGHLPDRPPDEPLQPFPAAPATPEEMERHHGAPVPSPLPSTLGLPSRERTGVPQPGGAPSQPPGRAGAAAAPRAVPLGFLDPEGFARFGRQLYAGLQAAGYPDVHAALRGSAVTGKNFRTQAPFDTGRVSDLDVALASPSLFQRATNLGIKLRSEGQRTRPLDSSDLEKLGLLDLEQTLNRQVGRRVSIMIYNSPGAIDQRGPNVPIPR